MLLPLDVLKIKRQVNPEAFRGRGIVRIVMEENFALYRGWGWTMARNAPGSFAVRRALLKKSDQIPLTDEFVLFSCSVPRRSRKTTSSASRTTQKRLGPIISSPPLLEPLRPLQSQHHSTPSRPVFKMPTSRPTFGVRPLSRISCARRVYRHCSRV